MIADRVAAWRRSGDLADLWPDVEPAALARAQAAVRDVTAAVLRGDGRPVLPGRSEADARALGIAGFISGMGPLLGWWIERGRVAADARASAVLAEHLHHGRLRSARLRAELERVTAALRAEGVDPIVLKGMHTGSVYFPDPATRPAADLDLLVRPDERARTAAALRAAGLVERRRTRWSDRSEWSPAGATGEVRSLELEHADDPWTIDLHVALERWYFRGVRRGLGEPTAEPADGLPRGLAQPQLLAFLALHASHDLVKTRLVRLLELVLVARRDAERGTLDFDALAALLERTDTGRFAYPALALADDLAPGTFPRGLLRALGARVGPRARRVMDAVRAAGMAPLRHRSLDAKLMWARGARETALNLSELLVPSDTGGGQGSGLAVQASRLRALARGTMGRRAR